MISSLRQLYSLTYYTNAQQGNLVQNWPMTVELKVGEADLAEYNVASGANVFRASQPWLLVDNLASTSNYNNWLQPAIAHLGVNRELANPKLNLPLSVVISSLRQLYSLTVTFSFLAGSTRYWLSM